MYEKIYYSLHDKKNEYRRETNYSKEGIQWLEYLRAEHNLDIRHALNASHGEKRIGNYSVDGFCRSNNTVYEYFLLHKHLVHFII